MINESEIMKTTIYLSLILSAIARSFFFSISDFRIKYKLNFTFNFFYKNILLFNKKYKYRACTQI